MPDKEKEKVNAVDFSQVMHDTITLFGVLAILILIFSNFWE